MFKKYWTDKSNDAMLCGNLLVTLDNEEKNDEFVIRNFKLKKNEVSYKCLCAGVKPYT